MLSQHTNLNTNYVTKHKGLPKKGCSVDFSEKGKNRLLSQPIKHLAYLNLSSPTLLIIHLCQYTRKFNMEFVFFFFVAPWLRSLAKLRGIHPKVNFLSSSPL